jgi:GPH family glycoside/pentoside/hexuronide:cation symporter
MPPLSNRALAAYAAAALPLAAAALPVYVHAPKFYSGLGLDLALIGILLLAVRVLDAVSDPLLGLLADRVPQRWGGRKLMLVAAVPVIAAGMWLLFHPPVDGSGLATWLVLSLILVYLGLSAASISYFALGSAWSRDYAERTRITAARGAAALTGVLLAAALPEWLAQRYGAAAGLGLFSIAFAPLLVAAVALTVLAGPRVEAVAVTGTLRIGDVLRPLRNPRFRRLAAIFLVNGVAAAIPATLVLFYVADVLQRPDLTALFLVLYFIAGAAGMPAWVRIAAHIGKAHAWLLAMVLATAAFISAWFLGPGDVSAFAIVCVLSGLAFGADLALPASLLADVIDDDEGQGGRPDGAYFGLWHLLEKLALALAAGLALPLLQVLGYVPGIVAGAGSALSWVYALLPCAIKLAAALMLWLLAPESGRTKTFLTGDAT